MRRVFEEDGSIGACTGRVEALGLETEAQRLFEANGGFGRGTRRISLPADATGRLRGLPAPLICWAVSLGAGCSMAFRRNAVDAIGGFDPALDLGSVLPGGGDLDAFWRVLQQGFTVVYEPRALVRHEHRRELSDVEDQLVGHQLALITFLTKTQKRSAGAQRFGILTYLLWRLVKPGTRLVRRLAGRDPLPSRVLLRMWGGCIRGLFAYPRMLRIAAARQLPARHSKELQPGSLCEPRPSISLLMPGVNLALSYSCEGSNGITVPHERLGDRNAHFHPRLVADACAISGSYRGLLKNLVLRDVKVKYQRSVLGFVWTLLNPLFTVLVLWLVFSHVMRIDMPRYWAFLVSGYFVWNCMAQSLNAATRVLDEHASLSRNVVFPERHPDSQHPACPRPPSSSSSWRWSWSSSPSLTTGAFRSASHCFPS